MDFLTADISFKYARITGFITQLCTAPGCHSSSKASLEMQFLFIHCEIEVFLRVDTQ